MPTPIDHLGAMLAQLTPEQLAQLPRVHLEKLSDALYRAHVLAEQAAGQQPFPRVTRNDPPKAGVLADLQNGAPRHE